MIDITNQQKRIPLSSPQIVEITKRILKYQRIRAAELSLVFVTDRKIKTLNKKYRHQNHATDVLAFDLSRPHSKIRCPEQILNGEVVISTAAACRNSKSFHATPCQELILYIIHGILHLAGFNDHKHRDLAKMRKREGQILRHVLKFQKNLSRQQKTTSGKMWMNGLLGGIVAKGQGPRR